MAGSDKRRRLRQSLVRWTDEEFNAIAAKADKAGLAIAAFMRAAALGDAGPRAQRRPPADHKALRQILGELGRIGNNINQIARALNTGVQASLPDLQKALRAYLDLRRAILNALGKDPGP
jgi:hypothetical protein